MITSAQNFDPMLAGEIPVEDGVIITDGVTLLHSPESFGEDRCLSTDYDRLGAELIEKLNKAMDNDRLLVEDPFRLKRVSRSIRKRCDQCAITNEYGQSFVYIYGEPFNAKCLINAFEAVGTMACGYIASKPDLFYGKPYLIIESASSEYGGGIRAILIPSWRRDN